MRSRVVSQSNIIHRRDIINEIPDHDAYLMLGNSMVHISARVLFELSKQSYFKYAKLKHFDMQGKLMVILPKSIHTKQICFSLATCNKKL